MHGNLIREEYDELNGVEVVACRTIAKHRPKDVITEKSKDVETNSPMEIPSKAHVLKTIIRNAISTVVNICVVKYSSVKAQASHNSSCMVDICITMSFVFLVENE